MSKSNRMITQSESLVRDIESELKADARCGDIDRATPELANHALLT